MRNLTTMVLETVRESMLAKLAILGVCLGSVPVYLLSMAVATLR